MSAAQAATTAMTCWPTGLPLARSATVGHAFHNPVVQKLPPACFAQWSLTSPVRCPLHCAEQPCQLRVKLYTEVAKQLYRVRKVRIYFPRSLLRDNEVRTHCMA